MSSGYIPPPPTPGLPPSQPGYAPPPAQSPSSKKLMWIVLTAVGAIIVLVMLFVGAIFFAVFQSLKASTPYQHAVEVATHDPRVLETLGAPVKPGWLPGGSINVSGESGHADLAIPLEGAAHKGKLYIVASKAEGEWSYQILTVRVEGGTVRINLLRPPSALPEEK
jgi:Cytochrome oxidase complex assembly protein 1